MHIIELHIHRFLQKINKGNNYKIPQELLEKFSENSKAHLKRQFEREHKNFTLRMSNIGHNLCQLECEQAGIPGEDTTNIIRNVYGDLCEDILMFLLLASGVPIVSSQEQVSLKLGKHKIDGTLDVVIEFPGDVSRVWDLKSVSEWVFKNKCKSYEDFIKGDAFGYRDQLFLYAAARNVKAGGWIIFNKTDGQIKVIEVLEDQKNILDIVLKDTETKLDLLSSHTKGNLPRRRLDTIEEVFRGKSTGNRTLDIPCTFCAYKWHCWPKLQLKPKAKSTAKDPPLVWYSEYIDDHSLSK